MKSCISTESIKELTNNFVDIATFTAIGHFCGRYVNHLTKTSSLPSIIGKLEVADLKSAAVCCALFVTIDRLVQGILDAFFENSRYFHTYKTDFTYSCIRITLNTIAAVTLFNLAAPTLKLVNIEMYTAATIISTAIVTYGMGQFILNSYNNRP